MAFGKSATQSSTFSSNFSASNATDGAGSELSGTTHTASADTDPFWEVDLAGSFEIDHITIHNRQDTAQGRLRDLQIEILDENLNVVFTSPLLNPDNVLGGDVTDFQDGPDLVEIDLVPTFGAHVRIRRLGSPTGALDGFNFSRPSDEHVIAMDEVQVFAISDAADFLLGDVDRNGVVDFLDIAPFIALLSSGGFQDEADIDGDGSVDFLDVAPFIAILSGQ